MPIPRVKPLLLPVLQMIADGRSVEDIRERVRVDFEISPEEMAQKLKNDVPRWHNYIAWALAYLVMGKAITLTSEGAYQVTQRGADLKANPQELTIKALRRFYDEATQTQTASRPGSPRAKP